MGWQERIVYFRDFAYAHPARRTRMASGTVGDVPAATYAEYVHQPSLDFTIHDCDGASDSSSDAESHASDDANAPDETRLQVSQAVARCLPVRPGLAHRLNSHRLHVRAKAKLQRDRLLSGRMIDIYVGGARRHWALHRNLLCHHSELLEAELQGHGKKRQDTLDLPDHDPAGFELLVKWLYQGKLDDVSDMADANQKYDYAVSCHKLYLLCDRFDMPQLKNVAMDQYRKGLNQAELVPDAEEIDEIYRKSPEGSPFRRLMTRIAARQIMDPDSDRDVETYRQCFENNPDFAVDLVKAMKFGTGGMLFDDPTDTGNECEYHDHNDGPNCHVKGKGKGKQVETSTEHATAGPPSPKAERDKFRRVTPPERLLPSPPLTEESQSHPVPVDHPPNSDGGSHQASITSSESGKDENAMPEFTSPPRGIWQWARAGSRLNVLGRIPHPPMTLKAATTAVNGALGGSKAVTKDDFSVPSTVSTEPHNEERLEEAAVAKMEGLGIANSTVEQHSLFTQTKRSSDDLVASINDTPSPQAKEWTNGEDVATNGVPNEPITPSPASRKAQTNGVMSDNTPSPHRIPKYKIALASHILSPSRAVS
ncbi:hypothetical protein SLS60_002952 [Paraconiothyrium brasiliense]|uniref:BTB domain-containing protein n=1 Tax=Paraconiothyrium brasiliense TaxID=300254 RepID=A0ABR3RUS1_9PLEO